MSERFFLDTNIFLYLFDEGATQKARTSINLISAALSGKKGAISFQVIQEFFSVVFKRVSKPMTPADAHEYLRTTLAPLLAVHSSATLYDEALNFHAAGGLSWYDALIVAAALQARCTVLYTEDLQHGRQFGSLKVVNPFL
jgi:predicted nucleic acid-binding protein